MSRIIITMLMTLAFVKIIYSQSDHNGNPVFNSVMIDEEPYEGRILSLNYYTLKNNIEDNRSTVFISPNPTLDQIQKAAKELPSDFYVLSKNQSIICMILVLNNPKRQFLVVNPATGEQKEYKCKVKGDISENRSKEIIENKYDSKANLADNVLLFNNNKLKIYSNNEIKEAIIDLIKSEKLNNNKLSNIKTLTQAEIKDFMLKESKEKGKLDFFTPIKGKEYDGVQIKPGIFSTNLGIALYKWGKASYELGVNKLEDAYAIFSEFKGRALNQKEKDYLKLGFERSLEK